MFCKPECKPGYTGLNCTVQCPYPTYGEKCQGYCDCSNESCDKSLGCRILTTPPKGGYFLMLILLMHINIYAPLYK